MSTNFEIINTSTYVFPAEVEAVVVAVFYSVHNLLKDNPDCEAFHLSLTDHQRELILNTNLFDYLI